MITWQKTVSLPVYLPLTRLPRKRSLLFGVVPLVVRPLVLRAGLRILTVVARDLVATAVLVTLVFRSQLALLGNLTCERVTSAPSWNSVAAATAS